MGAGIRGATERGSSHTDLSQGFRNQGSSNGVSQQVDIRILEVT